MANVPGPEKIVLKVLTGVQAGAEVALEPGDYFIGSGPDDDIQFIDISLKHGHGKLRLAATKMELQGAGGGFVTNKGTVIPGDTSDWFELEPLEIVTAGTTQFALGPRQANWTSLSEVNTDTLTKKPAARPATKEPRGRLPISFTNAALGLALLGLAGAFAVEHWSGPVLSSHNASPATMSSLRTALDALPFAKAVTLREDTDGTIYASGYVETAADRRAVAATAERLAIALRMRVNVLESMRKDVDTLIKSLKVPVDAKLDTDGVLTLDGLILDAAVEQSVVERIKSDVSGVARVESRIRTAKTLLADVQKLARKAQIDPYVVLRLEGTHIEINGILPVEQIDRWVGFLQDYSKQFAKDIAMRSFVQLQSPAGAAPLLAPGPGTPAISIGPAPTNSVDITLDIDRIRRGLYQLSDLFIGQKTQRPTVAATPGATAFGNPDPSPIAVSQAAGETPGAARDLWQLTPRAGEPQASVDAAPSRASGPDADRRSPTALAAEATQAARQDAFGPIVPDSGAPDAGVFSAMAATPNLQVARTAPSAGSPTQIGTAAGTAGVPGALPGTNSPFAPSAGSPTQIGTAAGTAAAPGTLPGTNSPFAPSAGSPTQIGTAAGTAAAPGALPGTNSPFAPSAGSPTQIGTAASTAAAPGALPGTATAATGTPQRTAIANAGQASSPLIGSQPGEIATNSVVPPNSIAAASSTEQRGAVNLQAQPAPARATADTTRAAANPGAAAAEKPKASTPGLLTEAANRLIALWQSKAPAGATALPARIRQALDRIAETRASLNADAAGADQPSPKYLPLMLLDLPAKRPSSEVCWPGARIKSTEIAAALFWLDVLSVSEDLRLKDFTLDEQRFLLEVALNPAGIAHCLEKQPDGDTVANTSLYLREALRNPEFIRFIVRDMSLTDIDVSGVNLTGGRFLQFRDGIKHSEGTAIDIGRRLNLIGELGAIVRGNDGYRVIPYATNFNWKLSLN